MVVPPSRTGFGTADAFVPFEILYTSELLATWEQPSYTATKHVPGSDINILFLLGLGPLTVTWTLEFANTDAYRDMTALVQTMGTLTIPQSIAERFGYERDLSGVLYTEYRDVVLLSLSGAGVAVDGVIEADATFYREARS